MTRSVQVSDRLPRMLCRRKRFVCSENRSVWPGMANFIFDIFRDEFHFDDDGYFTYSSTEQKRVEDTVKAECEKFVDDCLDGVDDDCSYVPTLWRNKHINYLCQSLIELPKSCSSFDSSRPWFCYWGMHSLRLLEASLDEEFLSRVVRFLKTCEYSTGGYGGGPGQDPHLATTYGAIMALISIGTDEALASINRKTLKDYLKSSKQPDGSFALHNGGEIDIRGSYCALSVASITNLLDDELAKDADSWIMSCQTYEGGFGGVRSAEAHGGYTFCGFASLIMLGKSTLADIPSLFKWLARKQMKYEGGFQGRTNKLVDACYSFWQSAVLWMIEFELQKSKLDLQSTFNAKALEEFVLVACQDAKSGGFRDKPDRSKDMYHTCYALSGLSVAQCCTQESLVGGEANRLARVSPVYNICENAEKRAHEYFSKIDAENK